MFNQNTSKQILTNNLNQRITFFEYLYVLVLIIYAGGANTFIQSASLKGNQISFLIPIVLSIILAIRWKVFFDNKRFYALIFGLYIYFLASSIKYHIFHVTIFINYLVLFFIVFIVIKALKFNFFKIYERLLTNLAIIGLIMWLIQFVLGGDSLFNIFSKIPGIRTFSYVTGKGLNALFYSVQPSNFSTINNFGSIPRNCGFAWEPGAFAVYLCLAIFINLFITKSENNNKFRFWILLSALITTQSTTGFIIFIIILLFYYANKKLNIVLLALPIVLIATVYIFSLPFMGDKIVELVNETSQVDVIVKNSINNDVKENPQRFVSFMIGFRDFLNNPILGIQGGENESWTEKINANISVISGLGDLLAENGLVGFLFFFVLSIKSSSFLSEHYNYRGKLLLFLIIFSISISYTIILRSLIMIFWMFSFFKPNELVPNHQQDKIVKV